MAKIYVIYNKINGKKYVGETTGNVAKRFCQHIDHSYREKDSLTNFHQEIKESGENVFEVFGYKILEECDDKIRFEKEMEYIIKIKPEYNKNTKNYYLIGIQDQIVKEYESGKTITEIRQKYKCRHQTIAGILKSNNISIQKSRHQFSKPVFLFNSDGYAIRQWPNATICANELHIDRGNIRLCCLRNTKENILYFSAEKRHFKYNNDVPKDMFKVVNVKTNETITFKTKEALTDYFKMIFPNKHILYGQLVRDRKTIYGYKIEKLYEYRN